MSVTGFWFVGVTPDDAAIDLARRLGAVAFARWY
jgi:hypothetical protein